MKGYSEGSQPCPFNSSRSPQQVKDLVTAQPVMTPLWAAPEVVRHERASIKVGSEGVGGGVWDSGGSGLYIGNCSSEVEV